MKFSKDPKKTIYIYCRVSTTGQKEDGSSLDVQKERGIKLSKKLNLSPVVIQEQGSGLKPYIEVRPKFSDLMDGIDDGRVKNVWIDEDTRLTRFDVDQQFIHISMKKNEVDLYVGTSTTPKKWDWITDLVDTLITKVNQNQIKTQVRKSIRSKRKLFQEGKYMKGDPPFGYKLVDRSLEIHEDNSEWVKKIYRWYDDGKSTVWIRKELFTNQVPPPRSKTTKNEWFPLETIVNILKNKNYIGIDVYGDLTNECPVIVDKDLFNSVQKKIVVKQGLKPKIKHDFLLRGILKCSDGQPMSCLGQKKSRRNPLYSCGHRLRKYKNLDSKDCVISKSLRMDVIDQYVWDMLIDTLKESSIIRETTKKEFLGKNPSYTKRTFTNRIKKLNQKMMDLDENRLTLEKRFYTNQMDKKRFDVLIQSIEEKEQEFMEEIDKNNFQIQTMERNTEWIDWLDIHFSRLEEIRETSDLEKRKGIITHYIHEIVCLNYDEESKQHTLSYKFRFPLFDDKVEWLKNKNGTYKLDRFGRRRYKIQEGKKEMNNPFTLSYLLNRDTFNNRGWENFYPFLVFEHIVTTHHFSPHQYNRKYHERKLIRDKVWELHNKGWGYTKIHRYLISNGYEIGKSRTCVDTMIRKRIKREKIINQPEMVEKFVDFRMEVFKS